MREVESDALAVCKRQCDRFGALKQQLRWKVLNGRGVLRGLLKDEARKTAFDRLAGLIDSSEWVQVAPAGEVARITRDEPFTRQFVFDPANWPEIDATAISNSLRDCRDAFRDLIRLHNLLSHEERAAEFPNGRPQP